METKMKWVTIARTRATRMKITKSKIIAVIMMITMFLSMPTIALPASAKPTTFHLICNYGFFEWNAGPLVDSSFGEWTQSYLNEEYETVFEATTNSLRYTWEPTTFVKDDGTGFYIRHGGPTSWEEGGFTIVQYSKGYWSFSGTPSQATFQHGVEYSWGYIYGADEATVKATYPYAIWDEIMGAWLVHFDVELFDSSSTTYALPFPSPFIEPLPRNNYNPLGL